jgi:signal transduction histidine kinase
MHPLEVFAPFRRWPPSPLRNLVYTVLWNCLLGLALALATRLLARGGAPFAQLLGPMLLAANVIGFLIHGALAALRRLAPRACGRGLVALSCKLLLIGTCAVLGIALSNALLQGTSPLAALTPGPALAPLLTCGLFVAVFMVVVQATGERRIERETLAARQQEQIAAAGQLLAEARLRALQAQIEPHFLYNTLANVVSLIDTRPADARRMLERFIDYLRASLAASRGDQATLGAELDLAGAYLDVLAVRLGARLRYRIEAAEGCRPLPIAPMLLQPLVENAVKHGALRRSGGGQVLVRVTVVKGEGGAAARLVCSVEDNGPGMGAKPPRSGAFGLHAVRRRLELKYADACMRLESSPDGTRSIVELPCVMAKERLSTSPGAHLEAAQ